jgi:hypothetical protein
MQLIEACEAIERNLFLETNESKNNEREKKVKKKNKNEKGGFAHGKSERSKPSMFYCSEHGNNPTHATADCYTLKNREKNGKTPGEARIFSNKSFRKELNHLAKSSSKKKVLEMYATVVRREQAKLDKHATKRKTRAHMQTSEDSDSDASLHMMDTLAIQKAKKRKPKRARFSKTTTEVPPSSNSEEEEAYQAKMLWLKDHGDDKESEGEITSESKSDN